MVNTSGTGGIVEEFTFSDDLLNEIAAFSDKRVKRDNLNNFIGEIRYGVQNYLNFHKWDCERPSGVEIRNQLERIEKLMFEISDCINSVHYDTVSFIEQEYLLEYREQSFLMSLNASNDGVFAKRAEFHGKICKKLIEDLGVRQGRPSFGAALHIANGLEKGLSKHGIKSFSISSEKNSVFVRYLDIILSGLSKSNQFGKDGFIFDKIYSETLARSLARSYIKRKAELSEAHINH